MDVFTIASKTTIIFMKDHESQKKKKSTATAAAHKHQNLFW